jgi:tRNA A37 methylthiotransferase MiaB
MDKKEVKEQKKKDQEEELIWCEHFKEYISIKEGCKHPQGYCPYRSQCILYLSSKFKDF